jgi:hypothetical protein
MQNSIMETLLVVDLTIKLQHKIFGLSLSNLASKLKFAENWKTKNGFSGITPKFQEICWNIYYFSERLRCRLSEKNSKFLVNFWF